MVVSASSCVRIIESILFNLHFASLKINMKEMMILYFVKEYVSLVSKPYGSFSTAKKRKCGFHWVQLGRNLGQRSFIPICWGSRQLFMLAYISCLRQSVSLKRKWLFWIGGLIFIFRENQTFSYFSVVSQCDSYSDTVCDTLKQIIINSLKWFFFNFFFYLTFIYPG